LLLTEVPAKLLIKKKLVGRARQYWGWLQWVGGWWGMDWQEKVTIQNCGRALVKPKNQPGGLCWLLNG